jgi:hypothetical protein
MVNPSVTLMARSILPLAAIVTTVASSERFPTIGMRISPMKVSDMPPVLVIELIESTWRVPKLTHRSNQRLGDFGPCTQNRELSAQLRQLE